MSILATAAEGELINPLLPAGYDLAWSAIMAFAVVAAIAALVSIWRHSRHMKGLEHALWVAICLFIGVVGPIIWFTIGRRKAQKQASAEVQPAPV